MTKPQPVQTPKHDYVVELVGKTTEPRVYSVRITGEVSRHFFVEISLTQNVRHGIPKDIEEWCKKHFDELPEDGNRISVNLDEVERNRTSV